MRGTVEWLVGLDPAAKAELSVATASTFTTAAPAPALATFTTAAPAPAIAETTAKPTQMATVDAASAEAAQALAVTGSVCLLNFASGFNCGGGFDHKSGSQEEDIFRKTSCFLSLWPRRRAGDEAGVLKRGTWIGNYNERHGEPMYPLTECGAIYSPNVVAVRDLVSEGTPLLDHANVRNLPRFSLITAAAQNPRYEGPFREDLLREKLRTILWLAAIHGHDTLVLGAFGAGYFRNPVDVVVRVFEDLLTNEFNHRFRRVFFAVPKKFKGNFAAFARRFPEQPFP